LSKTDYQKNIFSLQRTDIYLIPFIARTYVISTAKIKVNKFFLTNKAGLIILNAPYF